MFVAAVTDAPSHKDSYNVPSYHKTSSMSVPRTVARDYFPRDARARPRTPLTFHICPHLSLRFCLFRDPLSPVIVYITGTTTTVASRDACLHGVGDSHLPAV